MWSNNALLIFSVILVMLLSLVGAHFGIGGVGSYTGGVTMEQPTGIVDAFTKIGDSVAFLWGAVTFQLEGVPALFNIILFTPIGYILVYIVIKLLRGTE